MHLEYNEIILLVAVNLLYILVTGRIIWKALAGGMQVSRVGLGAWVTGVVVIAVTKICLIEYLYYLNRTHSSTTAASYLSKLFVYEVPLLDSFGLLATESEAVWRLSFYAAIAIVAIFAAVPLGGLRMKPKYR